MPTIPPKASPATSALEEHWPDSNVASKPFSPITHCNTLFIEIAKTDKCNGTIILFAHRVSILYMF